MTKKSLRLRRQGKKYSFIDERLKREWTIHPFAFDLIPIEKGGKGEAGLTIDWEHEGWGWHNPRDVNDSDAFGGVPRLAVSLRRAWIEYDIGEEAGKILASGLEDLQEDHLNGARILAAKALDTFTNVVAALDAESQEEWWKQARMVAWNVWKNGRESMGAAILNVMLSSLKLIESRVLSKWKDLSKADRGKAIREALEEYGRQRLDLNKNISSSFQSLIETNYSKDRPVRVLTLSGSSTISRCLTDTMEAANFPFDLRILESRPRFEGAALAAKTVDFIEKLNANSATPNPSTVTVFTDACAAIAAKDVDLVLLGADVISSDGDVCNKTGSLPAVLSAKHVSPSVKVVAIADKEKVFPFEPPAREENDPEEITGTWYTVEATVAAEATIIPEKEPEKKPVGDVKNLYFEWVESGLVDDFVLEDGCKTAADIREIASTVEKEASRFFDEL